MASPTPPHALAHVAPCLAAAGLQVGAQRVHHPQRPERIHFKLKRVGGWGGAGSWHVAAIAMSSCACLPYMAAYTLPHA